MAPTAALLISMGRNSFAACSSKGRTRKKFVETGLKSRRFDGAAHFRGLLGLEWFPEPERPDLDGLEGIKGDRERFVLGEGVFYLHAPDGIGRSRLAAKAEKLLGVPATARNWRTVRKVMDMAGQRG